MHKLRIAAFQRKPHFDDASQVLAQLCEDLTWCALKDVHLAVFPECYLQGYATDTATISRRAVEMESELIDQLRSVTAGFATDVVIGFVERRAARFFNTAVILRNQRILGACSKSHPNEPAFEAGDEYPVFDLLKYRYGINICNDANYPESAFAISAKGANLLCYPLNNMLPPAVAEKWRSKSLENLQSRAIDTGCWVVSSDVVGSYEGKIAFGCTCIVSPAGEVVSQVSEGVEGASLFDIP